MRVRGQRDRSKGSRVADDDNENDERIEARSLGGKRYNGVGTI